jgi:hypothetical protein
VEGTDIDDIVDLGLLTEEQAVAGRPAATPPAAPWPAAERHRRRSPRAVIAGLTGNSPRAPPTWR